jgi:hypothetical protein
VRSADLNRLSARTLESNDAHGMEACVVCFLLQVVGEVEVPAWEPAGAELASPEKDVVAIGG